MNTTASTLMLLHRVFVYGTLKTLQPNYPVLVDPNNGAVQFIAKGVTTNHYPLVVSSSYNIPFILPFDGQGKNIHGEVYTVDDKMLKFLDEFEGHPTWYQRTQIPITIGNTSDLCGCYILQNAKPELLQLPFLDNYDNNDPQGLKYVLKEDRTSAVNLRRETQTE